MSILNSQGKVTFDSRTTEAVVRKKSGKRIKGQFSAISPLTNIKRRRRTVQADVFDLLDQVSKGAFSVFNNLKYNRSEENNITRFEFDGEMTKTQRETHSRKVGELKVVGLIRNVKKQLQYDPSEPDRAFICSDPKKTFIINPEMIRCTNHDEAEYLWGQCAEEN